MTFDALTGEREQTISLNPRDDLVPELDLNYTIGELMLVSCLLQNFTVHSCSHTIAKMSPTNNQKKLVLMFIFSV